MQIEELPALRNAEPDLTVMPVISGTRFAPSVPTKQPIRPDLGGLTPAEITSVAGQFADILGILDDAQLGYQASMGRGQLEMGTPPANEFAVISVVQTDTRGAAVELRLIAGDFSGMTISLYSTPVDGISITFTAPSSLLDMIGRRIPAIKAALERRGFPRSAIRIRPQSD
jgi:hypothetical protein